MDAAGRMVTRGSGEIGTLFEFEDAATDTYRHYVQLTRQEANIPYARPK